MVPGLPPGPDAQGLPGFASAEVPPVMLTAVASMRGRTNSLVIIEIDKKKRTRRSSCIYVKSGSHEVCDLYTSVVAVAVCSQSARTLSQTLCEGVRDHAVASLEADLGLEGVGVDCTNLLERDVRAVEQTSIIRRSTLITCNVVVLISNVCRVRINVDLDATVECTNQSGGSIVRDETIVTTQSRCIVKNACHTECRNNISRSDQDVALPATSLLTDCVCISFDLEQKTLELLNRPTTIGVNVEVEDTSVSGIVLSTSNSVCVDSSNNFSVDFCQDLSAENVGQLLLSIQTMNRLQVLCEFDAVLSFQRFWLLL